MKIKRGSKKKNNGQWDARVAVYMSKELHEWVQKMASLTGTKEATYIRQLLISHKNTMI